MAGRHCRLFPVSGFLMSLVMSVLEELNLLFHEKQNNSFQIVNSIVILYTYREIVENYMSYESILSHSIVY